MTSLFASDWDEELESMREGWEMFVGTLRLYLTEFKGQRCVPGSASQPTELSLDDAWSALGGGLGVENASGGERVSAAQGAPALAGRVDRMIEGTQHRGLALRTDDPAPGMALLFANRWRGRTIANVVLYLFGGAAPDALGRDAEAWRHWLQRLGASQEPAHA